MTRRDFLRWGGGMTLAAGSGPWRAFAAAPDPAAAQCDVLVYGSTPGGIAAAVEAARRGCRVVLACPKLHPGGMLASGLGGLDSRHHELNSGFVLEYRQGVLDEYERMRAAGVPDWKIRLPGHGCEPSVVERVFDRMLAQQSAQLEFWRGHQLLSVVRDGARVRRAQLRDPQGQVRLVAASTFIDATYEGDLAAAAGVPFRVGRESAEEYGESLAGICYLDSKTGKILVTPDSGSASPAIQAYCARCVFTTDPAKRIPFEKPATYEQHLPDLWPLLDDFTSGRVHHRTYGTHLPGLKWELNGSIDQQTSLDCPGIGWAWPEADEKRRRTLEQFHVDHAASYFWFLQNEPRMPSALRAYWKEAGLHRDEFPDNGHWPWQIYVRQGRRIEGRERVTQHTFTRQSKTGQTPRAAQPIAVGEFAFDVHACHDRRFAVHGVMEGALWYPRKNECPAYPGQIPYGAMLPQRIDNLLVPLMLSSTHIGMSVVRMEPIWMVTGQVAGLAAAEAKATSRDVAQIDPVLLPARAKIIIDPDQATKRPL